MRMVQRLYFLILYNLEIIGFDMKKEIGLADMCDCAIVALSYNNGKHMERLSKHGERVEYLDWLVKNGNYVIKNADCWKHYNGY